MERPVLRIEFVLGGLLAVALLLSAPAANATRRVESYPKVMVYSSAIGLLPDATQDSLSWYDMLVCADRPEVVESLRLRNPNLHLLWSISPQFVPIPTGETNPWWVPDTLWSPARLIQFYALKNDWYLRDTSGNPITDGSSYVLNWTRYCPVGTYGSSKGLRAAEWIGRVALPAIAVSKRAWDPWSWNSQTSYSGYMFEILADCFGSYGWQPFAQADPNRNGIPDGVYSACSVGGADDPLSVLMRAENDVFYAALSASFSNDFVFVTNENNRYIGPAWCTHLSGMKLENWMRPSNPSWMDWWDWFYGFTPPWAPDENWGVGYAWAEAAYDRATADNLKGWDLSFIQVWEESRWPKDENLREMRWGLGTSMLGDGYFTYTTDQRHPLWRPEFDWDFGTPLGPFQREIPVNADTLYVRLFSGGMVEVNPYDKVLAGVPARDSRFTFWLPVQNLAGLGLRGGSIRVSWTAPDGEHNDADSYELRYSRNPITIQNWNAATPSSRNPVYAAPGSPVSFTISGLQARKTYYLAVRTHTRGRPEPFLSNVVQVRLPGSGGHNPTFPSTDLDPRSDPGDDGGQDEPDLSQPQTGFLGVAPNPFRTEATIGISVSRGSGPVRMTVDDLGGRCVRTLADGLTQPGTYYRVWDGNGEQGDPLPAGVYFLRIDWRDGRQSRKLLLLR